MYYVLFHYLKGQKERDFRAFRSEDDVIEFLHEKHKEIEVGRIIKTTKVYNLGLIEEEEQLKPLTRMNPEVPKEEVPGYEKEKATGPEEPTKEMADDEIIKENKEALASTEDVLDRANKAIEKGKRFLDKSSWELCPVCNANKMSPWNKTGKCSLCQLKRKSTVKNK